MKPSKYIEFLSDARGLVRGMPEFQCGSICSSRDKSAVDSSTMAMLEGKHNEEAYFLTLYGT